MSRIHAQKPFLSVGSRYHSSGSSPVLGRLRESALECPSPRLAATRDFGFGSQHVADDLFRKPVHYQYNIHPATFRHDLGHIDAPPLAGPNRTRLASAGGSLCSQGCSPNAQAMQPHQAFHTFGVDAHAVFMPESSPHAAVAPKRMLHFKGFDQRQELGIALKLSLAGSPPVAYQSFFFNSSVNSPTACLSF